MVLMRELKFPDTLLPSSPDFLTIEQAIREKYSLPEISPDWYGIHPSGKR